MMGFLGHSFPECRSEKIESAMYLKELDTSQLALVVLYLDAVFEFRQTVSIGSFDRAHE